MKYLKLDPVRNTSTSGGSVSNGEKIIWLVCLVVMGVFLLGANHAFARLVRVEKRDFIADTKIEIIGYQKLPNSDKPVLAIFDIHGTLLKPTWKQEYIDTYNKCTGRDDGEKWVEENAIFVSDDEIVKKISKISEKTIKEVEKILYKIRHYYRIERTPEVMPYALDMVKALYEKGIPIIAISGSDRALVTRQLKECGFAKYISEENIIGQKDLEETIGRNVNRDEVFDSLRVQFPFHTFVYFDDWIRGRSKIREFDGIVFGLPQGNIGSWEWEENRQTLINAGVNYILNGWSDWEKIAEILTIPEDVQKQDRKIPVAEGEVKELVSVLPAIRENRIPLYIEISDDLENVTFYEVINDSRVFLPDGTINYNSLKLREIVTIPSSYLVTNQFYIENYLDEETKNRLLELLSQEKRYTSYRGIITSWDKEFDRDVWTTNSDTVFLHEVIEEEGIFKLKNIKTALEVGTGGGHIALTLASKFKELRELSVTDISIYALRTAKRNLMPYIRKGLNMRYYWGKGIRGFEDGRFDLIVVNPPYIPMPPYMNSDEKDPYRGTGLIKEILEMGINKLNPANPDACIIMNVSSLARKDLEHYIQEFGDRFKIEKIGPELRLPLKISTIDDKWRDWLVKEGLLEYEPDVDGYKYWHRIQTYHIKPKP